MIFRPFLDSITALIVRVFGQAFVKKIGAMMLLTALGQFAYVLAGPLIGRIFSPDEIGIYGLFFTVWIVGSSSVCLMYDTAVPAATSETDAYDLTFASIVIGGCLSTLLGGAFSLSAHLGLFGLSNFPIWSGALLSICLFLQVLLQIQQGWKVRQNEVLDVGKGNVLLNFVRGIGQILLGLLSPLWFFLIVGEILGRLANITYLIRKNRPINFFRSQRVLIIEIIKKYRHFPTTFGPAFFIESAALVLQTTALMSLFGAAVFGQFFLMRRTLDMPVAFAFKSLSDLFFAKQISDSKACPDHIRPFLIQSTVTLTIVGALAALPIIFFGPKLFVIFFGENWETAGILAAIMSPAMVLNLAVAPSARIFSLSRVPQLRLISSVVLLVLCALLFVMAASFSLSLIEVTVGLSLAISLQYIVYFIMGYIAAGRLRISKN